MNRYSCLSAFALLLLNPVYSPQQAALMNPGFEERVAEGWTTHVYGAQPEISLDSSVAKQGRASLHVRSSELTDTAFGQEITLQPSRYYRLTGWVRTRGLNPGGAPVFGTFQVQQPGGKGVIASGENHGGDTDWTLVSIPFRSPADGRARVAVFFVGYGKGKGEAWFDDLRLEEVKVDSAPVRITREPLCPGKISPLQYGQFIEYLCTLVPGMWAEKLYDGSFEGLTPYTMAFLKETDFQEKPWYPSGAVNRAEYAVDHDTKVSGDVSKRIHLTSRPETWEGYAGISQDGIAVRKGKPLRLSVWLKRGPEQLPVSVMLQYSAGDPDSVGFRPTTEWSKYTAELIPHKDDDHARFSIWLAGTGTLWIDNASLMPADNVGGWRKDVVHAVKELRPGVIRFGGSALDDINLGDFRWRETIGDRDKRRPFRAWGGLQPAAAGLEEIVQFCKAVGAEPLICVRFTKSTPEEAAQEVEYFNGAPETPMGRLRAANGHREPYRIKYWQVGNEVSGAQYAAHLAEFCRAMKRVDPSIKVLSSYPTADVLRNAGSVIDMVCPHHYGCADLAGMQQDFDRLRGMIKQYAPGRDIKVAVTEWNTTAGDWGPRRAMLWTLENALACSRYHNLMHRNADLVEIANRSNLTNSFCSGIIQTDNHRIYLTPTYYAQRLYARFAGTVPLKIDSAVPADLAPDVSATLSADGKIVTLFAVNDTRQAIEREIDFSAFGKAAKDAAAWTLGGGDPDATNSFEAPERVFPIGPIQTPTQNRFKWNFQPLTLTVIRWKVADTH